MKGHQSGGLAEHLQDEVERRIGKLIKSNDRFLVVVDVRMIFQHGFYFLDDGGYLAEVVITQANGFANTAVRHARRVLKHVGGEQGIGYIDQRHVE